MRSARNRACLLLAIASSAFLGAAAIGPPARPMERLPRSLLHAERGSDAEYFFIGHYTSGCEEIALEDYNAGTGTAVGAADCSAANANKTCIRCEQTYSGDTAEFIGEVAVPPGTGDRKSSLNCGLMLRGTCTSNAPQPGYRCANARPIQIGVDNQGGPVYRPCQDFWPYIHAQTITP